VSNRDGDLGSAILTFLALSAVTWISLTLKNYFPLTLIFVAISAACAVQFNRSGGVWFKRNWGISIWLIVFYIVLLAADLVPAIVVGFSVPIMILVARRFRNIELERARQIELEKARESAELSKKIGEGMTKKGFVKYTDRKGEERWGDPERIRRWQEIYSKFEEDFEELTPHELEGMVVELFSRMGYDVEHVGKVGDYGGDVIAKKGKEKVLVQVKRYSLGNNISDREVRETLGARYKYKANKVVLVTTSDFTVMAREQAKEAPIELWNRQFLLTLFERYFEPEDAVVKFSPGMTGVLAAWIQNNIGHELKDARLQVSSPLGWKIELHPEEVSKLLPNETARCEVHITVPSNALPGDYYLSLRGLAKEGFSFRSKIKIIVEEEEKHKRYCVSCGNVLPEGCSYCPFCGSKVEEFENKAGSVLKIQGYRTELEEDIVCAECGKAFKPDQIVRCSECGKAYCEECAEEDLTIKRLGICPDCEEVYEAEEDYWGWK